jgi:hypothetical protein
MSMMAVIAMTMPFCKGFRPWKAFTTCCTKLAPLVLVLVLLLLLSSAIDPS